MPVRNPIRATVRGVVVAATLILSIGATTRDCTPPPAGALPPSCPAPYGYGTGSNGPANWSSLPGDAECGVGLQSPIPPWNSTVSGGMAEIATSYSSTAVAVENDSVAYVVGSADEKSYMGTVTFETGGSSWNLTQFHFHFPAEHSFPGVSAVGELHLVHANGDNVAVIAVPLVSGTANSTLVPVVSAIGDGLAQCVESSEFNLDPTSLVPDSSYYFYPGSKTTPPCSPAAFYLMATPLSLSPAQITALSCSGTNCPTGQNARPQGQGGSPPTILYYNAPI